MGGKLYINDCLGTYDSVSDQTNYLDIQRIRQDR